MRTLQLNADHTAIKVLPWERAVELVLEGKASLVEGYPGRFVRSAHLAIPWPAVIALKRYTRVRGRVRFSSQGVLARDGYTCAYCGVRPVRGNERPERGVLTLDHVVPRAQARDGRVFLPWARRWVSVSCWENALTACRACNARKAERTPAQAGMPFRVVPRVPTTADVLRMTIGRMGSVPEVWSPYLPERWMELVVPAVEGMCA